MGPGMFDDLGPLFTVLFVALVISVPLAIWKLCELVWWGLHHISIH